MINKFRKNMNDAEVKLSSKVTSSRWNVKLTETQIFRELSIEIYLIKSSLF